MNKKSALLESYVVESVESEIKHAKSKEDLMKKHNITSHDLSIGKQFLQKNPELGKKLKVCKSVKDIMNIMKSDEYKEAVKNDK